MQLALNHLKNSDYEVARLLKVAGEDAGLVVAIGHVDYNQQGIEEIHDERYPESTKITNIKDLDGKTLDPEIGKERGKEILYPFQDLSLVILSTSTKKEERRFYRNFFDSFLFVG